MRTAVLIVFQTLLLFAMMLYISDIQPVWTEEVTGTVVRVIPGEIVLGSSALEDVVGTTFAIAVVVENVEDLYGLDVQFCWNTTYLEYTNHTTTIPVEDYPNPIPPSPYSGVLNAPVLTLMNVVDEDGSIDIGYPEPGTMAWISYSSFFPAKGFDGNGTVCIMSFRVKYQPYFYELPIGVNHVNFTISFVQTALADSCTIVFHSAIDGNVKLYTRSLPPYGPTASFTVVPEIVGVGETVKFDASSSLPGFNGTHDMPITEYRWEFWVGDEITLPTPIVFHSFLIIHNVTYSVTLTVYSPGATPETDSISHEVTVISTIVGGITSSLKHRSLSLWISSVLLLISIIVTSSRYVKHKKS